VGDQGSRELFGAWLGLTARSWRAEIDRRMASHGLTEARWLVLLRLSRAPGPLTQKALAAAVGVQGPTLVRTLDWLEAEGLIERRAAAGDRRANSIHLTDRARPSLANIQAVVDGLRAELFAGIDDADLQTCLRVFRHIAGTLSPEGRASGIEPGPTGPDETTGAGGAGGANERNERNERTGPAGPRDGRAVADMGAA